jgi:hypothetical protein
LYGRWIVRREQRSLRFVVIDFLEVVILADGTRPQHRRPGIDSLEETLQVALVQIAGRRTLSAH